MNDSTKVPQEIHKDTITLGNMQFIGSPPDLAKLFKKLSDLCGGMDRVPKNGHNAFQNYDFARESDVVDHVRPQLAAANLYVLFSSEPLSVNYEHRDTPDKKHQVWASLELRGTICDGDTGAMLSFTMPGNAVDTNSDKAIYKAITGAKKYCTLLAFNIATGDDPENENRKGGGGKGKRGSDNAPAAKAPHDPDADAREASKARRQICARFEGMRDDDKRSVLVQGMFGCEFHDLTIRQLRELYKKLNTGEVAP